MDRNAIIDRLLARNYSVADISQLTSIVTGSIVAEEDVRTRIEKIETYKEKLEKLKLLPVIEQRSQEWYECRNNLLTASDFGQALGVGTYGNVGTLIKKKIDPDSYPFKSCPPLEWGVKFEPVAQEIYCLRERAHIHEFGLLKHPGHNFLGASPDGINENGVMLEIKCPYKRVIDGTISAQYFHQIQGQLDVCDLEECDFLECKFEEYETEEEFLKDTNYRNLTKNNMEKGIIIRYYDNGTKYLYSAIDESPEEKVYWKYSTLKGHPNAKVSYWYLSRYHVQRVYRNQEEFAETVLKLRGVWDTILEGRKNAPPKSYPKCMIVDDED